MLHLQSVRRSRGFSLVELIVVVAIMASLSLIAVPWFFKISQRNAFKSAAREIQMTLLAARMKAVKRNQPVTVLITSVGPPIELQTLETNPPAPTPTHVPGHIALPATAAQFVQTPNAGSGAITFGGDGRVTNFPFVPAPTPAAQMILRGPVGATTNNQIKINAHFNGRIEVVTPTNWE